MEKRSKAIEWIKDSSGLMEKRWYAYAMAGAGALVATAPAAHATIVSSGVLNQTITATYTGSDALSSVQNITLGVDPNTSAPSGNFGLQTEMHSSSGPILHFLAGAAPAAGAYQGTTGGNPTPVITAGQVIGPAAVNFTYNAALHPIGPSGNWNNETNVFLGLDFTMSDGLHYGWLELSTSFTLGNPGSYSATIEQFAYESVPDMTIDAGQLMESPEPSTAGLLLLGMGACGLAAWRKRKQAQRAA